MQKETSQAKIMPKRPKRKPISSKSPVRLAFLMVKIFLIAIENMPLWIVKYSINTLQKILSFIVSKRTVGRPKKFRLSKRSKIIVITSASLAFLLSYTTFLLTAAYQLPTPTKLASSNQPITTQIFDRNGKLLYKLYEGQNRTLVKLSDVPQIMVQATLAAEDQNFYHHPGIDPAAIIRAFINNKKYGGLEGASTLTQQLIKNSLLTPEKSYQRKIKEAILAIWAERIYSKDEILQMYFNEAPYGGPLVGIAEASETYFNKPPTKLTLAESAFLAGLPASPTKFSPYGTSPQLAKLRQKEVLQRMVKAGYINQKQADQANSQQLNIKPQLNNIQAPHFVFYVKDQLAQKYGPRVVTQGGLKIYTSLDLDLQKKVEAIVAEEIKKLQPLNVQNGAAMVIDGKTGQILAMVGSRDYYYPGFGNYNVTLALRQPGSSIKPITYAAALEKGYAPSNIILDTPVVFKDEWGNTYAPVNYNGKFHGAVTLRQALASSLNIPAVKLLANIGIQSMANVAQNLGITTFTNPERFGLSLTLGGADTKMIEVMGVYGAFSQNGKYHSPTGILKVIDSQNNVLDEYTDLGKQAITEEIAYLITHILSDDKARSLAFGTNSLLNIPGYMVAVKTGTSDNKRDNWAFGFTPKYVVGTWVGNPDNSPMNPSLASGITGATPIWNKIMHTLLDNTKPLAFEKPSQVVETVVDGRKDLNIAGNIPKALVRVKKDDNRLIFSDPYSFYATPSAQQMVLSSDVIN